MPRTRRSLLFTSLSLAAGVALADALWLEQRFIRLNHHYLCGCTPERHALSVVQLSDLHLRKIHGGLRRLCREITQLHPDIILLTGDAIDRADKLPVLAEFLALLPTAPSKLAVLGNWEYKGGVDLQAQAELYAAHGIRLLINESARLTVCGHTISITGVDDLVEGQADYGLALVTYQPADIHVVLTHCPQYADTIRAGYGPEPPVDLILAGHTHGGQIAFLGWPPLVPTGSGRYVSGWYRDEHGAPVFVSKGVGTSTWPVRFGARAAAEVFYF